MRYNCMNPLVESLALAELQHQRRAWTTGSMMPRTARNVLESPSGCGVDARCILAGGLNPGNVAGLSNTTVPMALTSPRVESVPERKIMP